MSAAAFDWLEDVEFTGSAAVRRRARGVLLVLAHFADPKTQIAHPGREKISKLTGQSTRTVDRALEDLTAVETIERVGSPSRKLATEYVLNLDSALIDLERAPAVHGARSAADRAPYRPDRAPYRPERAPAKVATRRTDNEKGTAVGDAEAADGPPKKRPDESGQNFLERAHEWYEKRHEPSS